MKALKRKDDGITHACLDLLCALMQPMHDNFDLKQEQLNKSSLLSSKKFVEMLIDLLRQHIVRNTIIMHNIILVLTADHAHSLVYWYWCSRHQCIVGLLHFFIVPTVQVRQ